MCGIFGIVSRDKIDKRSFERATKLMNYRGPDDFGSILLHYNGTNIGLGHQRLSIIDLSHAGHQPMCNEDKTVWLVYNGEIYNFKKIRELLLSRKHVFRSNTDTEVIIHAYEEWGTDCLSKFNGMFAFALWDGNKAQLFVARDKLGIKPLYYIDAGQRFVFSSEIKSILQIPGIKREVDSEGLYSTLLLLWVPDEKTIFNIGRQT